MDEGKCLHFHQYCQTPKTYFPALLLIDSLSLWLLSRLRHCVVDSLARNEVGSDINHPSHINRGDMHVALASFTVTSLLFGMITDL